jgi:hypothetical protein
MTPPKKYLLDADALMRAKRQHYRFCFCPGFWDFLLAQYGAGRLMSIDRVKAQIKPGDDLHDWVVTKAPARFFGSTRAAIVAAEYGKMMFWVNAQTYTAAAKAEFAAAENADGWLVAYAKAYGLAVVTHEVLSNGVKRVKIPNVCDQFGVEYFDTFDMLEDLKGNLILGP